MGGDSCRFISCSRWPLVLVRNREKISSVARAILEDERLLGVSERDCLHPRLDPAPQKRNFFKWTLVGYRYESSSFFSGPYFPGCVCDITLKCNYPSFVWGQPQCLAWCSKTVRSVHIWNCIIPITWAYEHTMPLCFQCLWNVQCHNLSPQTSSEVLFS
jgi:hypothetical protein